jgi:hypothetical protein
LYPSRVPKHMIYFPVLLELQRHGPTKIDGFNACHESAVEVRGLRQQPAASL